jgi:uncharacterized protein (TIGR02246 family)
MLLTVIVSLALAGAQSTEATADILKREQQRVDSLTTGKIDEVAAMLSPTLTYTHSSSAMDSRDKFLETLRTGQVAYKRLAHRDVQVRFPTPDVAVVTGLSDILVAISGKDTEVPVRFTIIYVKKQGAWLMELWHSTRRPS